MKDGKVFNPESWMRQLYKSERETVLNCIEESEGKEGFVGAMSDHFPFITDDDKRSLFDYFQVDDQINYLRWL